MKTYDRSPAVPDALTWLKKIAEAEGNDALVARYQHELALHHSGQNFAVAQSAPRAASGSPTKAKEAQAAMKAAPPAASAVDAPPEQTESSEHARTPQSEENETFKEAQSLNQKVNEVAKKHQINQHEATTMGLDAPPTAETGSE